MLRTQIPCVCSDFADIISIYPIDHITNHDYSEPVFITKNGKGDLAVMSIETYEKLTSRFELYGLIKEGMDDIALGNTRPFSEAMSEICNYQKPSCLLYH